MLQKLKVAVRLYSFQVASLATVLLGIFSSLTFEQQKVLLGFLGVNSPSLLAAMIFLLYVIARVVSQPGFREQFTLTLSSAVSVVFFNACLVYELLPDTTRLELLGMLNVSDPSTVVAVMTATLAVLRARNAVPDATATSVN